ncbi:MAG: hypothetical protein K6E11_02495 [Bacilli bacterium]|nr:hypothetical protein [Bacilli bacterium]
MEETNKKQLTLKMIMQILFWGAAWGIVEATLGTILHLPGFEGTGLYFASSAVILPIAYCLMANCYKRTGTFYSVFLMGLVAATIKLSVAFVIGFIDRVYFPAIYIVIEALAMGGALAIFRPTNVISLKTFASIVVANTTYQFTYLVIRSLTSANVFANMEIWSQVGEKYLFMINGLAILYSFAIGSIAFGVIKLAQRLNFSVKFNFNKLVSSPITAGIAVALSLALTIGLAAI